MDSARRLPADKGSEPQPLLSLDTAGTILWESIWRALIQAFLVQILGGIAINLVGSIFSEMTPSLPPILTPKPEAEVGHSAVSDWLSTFIAQNHFWIIFAVLLLVMTATRFARYLPKSEHRKLAARILRINRRLTGDWFGLFVVNGFTAWISTIVFVALQQFSWTQILWSVISGFLEPMFDTLGGVIPGAGSLGHWYAWYGQNQAKFVFWLLYSAAICDDLGLPNYKTLIRRGGRRLKRYFRARWGAGAAETSKPSVMIE